MTTAASCPDCPDFDPPRCPRHGGNWKNMAGKCPECPFTGALRKDGTVPAHRDRRETDPFKRDFRDRPMTMRMSEQGACPGSGKTSPNVLRWRAERGLPAP